MCGIVGYTGSREAFPLLLESLESVTYRGYDSFGVAVLNGRGIDLFKQVGPADQRTSNNLFKGTVGIGHTRWATIGGVSQENAHPHFDCSEKIAIVHNGDIDNYLSLRARLLDEGHKLSSETDSELIAHLVETYMDGDLCKALARAVKDIEGSYAVAVLDYRTKDIAVARHSSPVVIGVGEKEAFVASDAPAILPYTENVLYPEDGDIVLLRAGTVEVFKDGKPIHRPLKKLSWGASQAGKAGYEHYMMKEIHEQPQAIRDTLTACADRLPGITFDAPANVLMLACGTSYHAALYAEELINRTTDIMATVKVASEFVPRAQVKDSSLVIAISQSGETADTLKAVRALKAVDHSIIGITNVPESSLARESDHVLYTAAGPEVAVGATKTFTTQLVALALVAARLSGDEEKAEAIRTGLRKLPTAVEQTIQESESIKAAAKWLARYEDMFIVAKGGNYPVALEAALKLKEIAYIHAEGVPAGELKHGPFALLSAETPVLALVASDSQRQRMITAMREIAARGAPIITITDHRDEEIDACSEMVIEVPATEELLTPVLFTVASQLLSYYVGLERGCSIDRPRNLAKSVTVL